MEDKLKYYCVINKINKKISYGDNSEQTAKDYLDQFCDDTCELITLESVPLDAVVRQKPKDLGEKLCDYCLLEKKGVYSVPGGFAAGCEGSNCDEAYENYLDEVSA